MNILLTPSALRHVQRVLGAGEALRLSLKRGGCAGASYRLDVGAGQPDDVELVFDGFKLFVAAADAELLDGTCIDSVDDLTGSRITFTNPRETARCGCGQSVALCA